jgi:uncharacterized alpha-E superfamily protein
MAPLILLLLVGAGLLGYTLGRRRSPVIRVAERPPGQVVELRAGRTPAADRSEVAEAAQELSRWLESAGQARDRVSPATWERIAEASARIAAAAGRLAARGGAG